MKLFFFFIKPIIWFIIVIILSLIPGNKLPDTNGFHIPHFDKIVHFTMYFVFSFLMILSFYNYLKTFKVLTMRKAYIVTIIVTILIGTILEIFQQVLNIERSGDIADFIANAIGAFAGCIFFYSGFILFITNNKSVME